MVPYSLKLKKKKSVKLSIGILVTAAKEILELGGCGGFYFISSLT